MTNRYLFLGQYLVPDIGDPINRDDCPEDELICYDLEYTSNGFTNFKVEARDGIYSTFWPYLLVLYTEENLKLLARRNEIHARIKELVQETNRLTDESRALLIVTGAHGEPNG